MCTEFFTVLPMRKSSEKEIIINDSDSVQVGFIQRKYKNFWEKLINYLPLSFLETRNIDGETSNYMIKIREQSFKSNLFKLKWDIFLRDSSEENKFLLEDRTKISSSPRMVYHKNNKEYVFNKDIFSSTCEISLNNVACATVSKDKKISPNVKISTKTNDLTNIELLGIYYIIHLVY
ncbi:hypothetical protein QNH47_09790 [Virgibacillus halodenitrificans]|uniref:tubby C-terminal domain-like protein n=1 Tax=Virgibacillus halodenitrificans TaxID=1482 RepID=UPI0024C08E5E|nr:hypothetical protein [Virgibacillus halodenitrificans]WHX28114.1 hypothetical protein QNH47_09790 [Virgibacillus halodenitrificans]